MRNFLVLLIVLLLLEPLYADQWSDAIEMTPDDLTIDNVEYSFEPYENPTKLVYKITITNVTGRAIKYRSNIRISSMSQYQNNTDNCTRILEPWQSCIFEGYGYRKAVNESEFEIFEAGNSYVLQVVLSPTNVRTNPFKDHEDGVIKKKFNAILDY
jgi:hypothetical protein